MTSPVDKFLGDAISAARDHANDGVDDGAHTRLRLRESLANQGAHRRKRFTLIAALIASLFGSTAFAYWAGWRPPWSNPASVAETHDEEADDKVSMRLPGKNGKSRSSINAIPDAEIAAEQLTAPVEPAPIEANTATQTKSAIEPKPATEPLPSATEVMSTAHETESAKSAPAETKPAPRTVPRVASKPRVAKTAPVETEAVEANPVEAQQATKPFEPTAPVETNPAPYVPTPAETTPRVTSSAPRVEARKSRASAELAAYRHAHNLHFRGADPKAALAAWDAYLAKYPNGSLAPEARYDRALVLVKLARWSEARAALAPLANAKVGTYRQKEAAEILAAIRDR